MKAILRAEPTLIVGAVQALVALAMAFGLELTKQQVGAIGAAVAAVLAVVLRRRVTPWPGEEPEEPAG